MRLKENDSYWRDEFKKLQCNSRDNEDFIHEKLAKKKVDKLALKASLKKELQTLKYLNKPIKKDNLQLIQGIGSTIENTLNDLGVSSFSQIATWNHSIIAKVNDYIDFSGRIERERWVDQAQKLAQGEMSDFAKRVMKGNVPTSEQK